MPRGPVGVWFGMMKSAQQLMALPPVMAGVLQKQTPEDLRRQDRKRDVKRAAMPIPGMPALPCAKLSVKL